MSRPTARRKARRGRKKSIWAELGSIGGQVRARRLSGKERRRIAMLGVLARLANRKKRRGAARRRAPTTGTRRARA